jgi:hypothetical protein
MLFEALVLVVSTSAGSRARGNLSRTAPGATAWEARPLALGRLQVSYGWPPARPGNPARGGVQGAARMPLTPQPFRRKP